MFDHLSIGVSDLDHSSRFYDAVLGTLGSVALSRNGRSVVYGPPGFRGEAPFAIISFEDVTIAPGFHLAFAARNRGAVDAFFHAALAHGGADDGAPGIREHYGPGYYAAFVLDPDGYRLEAVVHESVEPNPQA